MTRDERILLLMIQQHEKGAKFLRTNERFCLGSALRPYFGTIAGIPQVFSFFFVSTGEGILSGATSEDSRLRVVKQWKVTGYLNQRIILAPDKSLRRVQLQYKHTDVCRSAAPASAYDANSWPHSTFDFSGFFYMTFQ